MVVMGADLNVKDKFVHLSYGHFSALMDDFIEWCRSVAKTEEEHEAVKVLAAYSVDDYIIEPETCAILYRLLLRESDRGSFRDNMHFDYEYADPFNYLGFLITEEAVLPGGTRFLHDSDYYPKTVSSGDWESYNKNQRLIKDDNTPWKKKCKAMDEAYAAVHPFHVSLDYDFSGVEYGAEDFFVTSIIELFGLSAIENDCLLIS